MLDVILVFVLQSLSYCLLPARFLLLFVYLRFIVCVYCFVLVIMVCCCLVFWGVVRCVLLAALFKC